MTNLMSTKFTGSWSVADTALIFEAFMSVIFGTYVSDCPVIDRDSLLRLASVTARYGPDGTNIAIRGQLGMGFQPFYTHSRSRLDHQPTADSLGNVIVLDGRLDNYQELANLEGMSAEEISDAALILRVFARSGEECFTHLIGDWALALWSARERCLYLARDHAGTRTLYYRALGNSITWATYLETFFVEDASPELSHEYLAHSLEWEQVGELTPYKGIHAVLPAHYVAIRSGRAVSRRHWSFLSGSELIYRSSSDYDEHFLGSLRQAVGRRIDPKPVVVAELSGGMDSSAIVCTADTIVGEHSRGGQIDTISYFDDTEPDWNERPYVSTIEKKRAKTGIHVDCSTRIPSFIPLVLSDRIYPYVVGDSSSLINANRFEDIVAARHYRVVISGLGGDELLGGAPQPLPELADLLRNGHLVKLTSRAVAWCLPKRVPLLHMLRDTTFFLGEMYRAPASDSSHVPPWLLKEARHAATCPPGESTWSRLASRPSTIANGRTWWALLETLPHLLPNLAGCYEYRYPYLDRDLVDFLRRIPRDQLLGPGRRRLLMRRALRGIVPEQVMERRRKAVVSRAPLVHLRSARHVIEVLFSHSVAASYGLIDRDEFLRAFRAELGGDLKWLGHLMRTIEIELWLQSSSSPQSLGGKVQPAARHILHRSYGHTSSA